jgi:hypothetical protein
MSPSFIWICATVLFVAFMLQGFTLRLLHRRKLEALRAEHAQVHLHLSREFEQLTEQLHRLRAESKQTRLTAAPTETSVATARALLVAARQALERDLDVESNSRFESKSDGFADTQVMAHIAEHSGLLLQ